MLTPCVLDPLFIYANYAEACLWAGLGVAALVKRRCTAGVMLAVALLAFGVSDLVEVQTGAWHKPWWLLVWKVACLALITAAGIRLWRRVR